ncbi:MAG TPA: FAD-dependent oxidoreductase [Glaciihabitans sp.]|jgi:monoamine oxidase|nr:FAD-dependent oxidoreductase [Glaciihabitans sp.]
MDRRTFLVGAFSGASLLALSACTSPEPTPTPTALPPSPPATTGVPAPSAFHRSAWTQDPYSLGATSYLPVDATPGDRTALGQSVDNKMFFAGEATSTDHAGTVAGAHASGMRVADEVASIAPSGDRIAVIGAGLSGAVAARQLAAAGYDVVVLEARDRVGGRISSLTGDEWPFAVEEGAAVVNDVVESPILGELTALGVTTELLGSVDEVRRSDGVVLEEPSNVASTVTNAVEWARESDGDTSLRDAINTVDLTGQNSEPGSSEITSARWLQHYVDTTVTLTVGADITEVSARYGWVADDSPRRVVVGEYTAIITNALDGLDVRLSSAVVQVTTSQESVGLRFATGESLTVDRVIVTVPLGVLKSDGIVFDPELPQSHQSAIATLGVALRESVILRFDEAFWDTEATQWAVVSDELPITRWVSLMPLTGEAVLIGSVAAAHAARWAELDDDAVQAEALASLEPFVAA